jgi:cytochrome c oxidase subunit 2
VRSFKSPLRWLPPMLGLMVIGSCAVLAQAQTTPTPRPQERKLGWWLPENVFTDSADIDTLFYGILWLTTAVCIGVFVALLYFLVKYRHQPGRHARFIHGNNRLEAAWTLIPTVILALIAAISQTSWARMKKPPMTPTTQQVLDGEVVEMRVVGIQFKWYFHYPGKDGKLGPLRRDLQRASQNFDELIGLDRSHPDAKDDIVTPVMYIPVNKPVYIHLTSVDVLHSFFLPEFRIKQDAVPGLEPRVWLEANRTSAAVNGVDERGGPKPFDIVCAELCGQGHYTMRGELYAVTAEQFAAWLQSEYEFLDLGDDDDAGDAGY